MAATAMTTSEARKELERLDDIEPGDLDAALKHIETIKDAMSDALDAFERREGELEDELSEAEATVTEAKERADDALMVYLEELARIHQKMKAGRLQEAIGDLDRVLQEADGDCRARTSAVAVML